MEYATFQQTTMCDKFAIQHQSHKNTAAFAIVAHATVATMQINSAPQGIYKLSGGIHKLAVKR
jgi:hypothetical protein